ncbi:GvpL/GvpF family gas vesicle protein [Nonomuraea turcica]|uniref:GvpL/GvpF family gas vesicle protein n=1 Tax=Nonomuraea sp. G32 TaxID=3067274 RepID=UPI00273CC2F7|nr:GvpL/GvpF family gas vesicle protein [Nonomuraea sp. G32]MDP4502067.1 GvpL/GvpF family gas vesicle protein [Nonomuraea sp. G32]
MTDTAVYLYAVTNARDPVVGEVAGVSGSRVRVVEHSGLTAVVSTVPLPEYGERALRENLEDLAWLEAIARAHDAVVRTVAGRGPTAPVRLATVFHDDRRVKELLEERRGGIERALSRVAGRSEWGVKVYGTAPTGSPADDHQAGQSPRDVPEGAFSPAQRPGPGVAYLRRRGAQRRRREDATQALAGRAEQVHARLAPHAIASHRHRLQDRRLSGHDGVMVLNAAYLIEDPHAFREAAADLAARWDDVRVEVTGPWPAYSFTTIDGEERA